MIKVNDIAFTAYPVADRQRARGFYEGVLNLKPSMDSDFPEGFWIEYDLGSNTLALSNFWKPAPNPLQAGPTLALEVEDFEQTLTTLKEQNIPFVLDQMETSVCHLAVIQDPDGNSLFIHKRKPKN